MPSLALSSNPLIELWRGLSSRFRFKFILPRTRSAKLEGVKLDISTLSPLMKNIILTGRYESQERRLATKALSRQDVVLELGGAIGCIGLYCRKTLGVRHVTRVEANPQTLGLLRRNYACNGLEPNVIHAAAAAEDGELDLNVGGEFWENTLTGTSSQTVRVPAKSFASIINLMPESPTALICDIEGAEQYLDFTRLPSSVNKIIIELHPSMTGQEQADAVLFNLARLGFAVREQQEQTFLLTR